jgi:hypothetical protein
MIFYAWLIMKQKYENKPEVGPLEFMELTQTLIQNYK